jgi:hypothetical protein
MHELPRAGHVRAFATRNFVCRVEETGAPRPAAPELSSQKIIEITSDANFPLHRQSYEPRAAFQRLYALGQASSSPGS